MTEKTKEFYPDWWDELVFDGPEPLLSELAKLSPATPAWAAEEYKKWWAERQARLEEARRRGGFIDKY